MSFLSLRVQVLTFILLLSCSSPQQKSVVDAEWNKARALDTAAIAQIRITTPAEYLKVLDTLDQGDLSSLYLAAVLFKNGIADSLTCDSLFAVYSDFLKRVAEAYLENNEKAGSDLLNSPSTEKIKKWKITLASYGIYLDSLNGTYSLKPNHSILLETFGANLTSAYRQFLTIVSREENRWTSAEWQSVTTSDSLITTIITWENFIHQNPGFIAIKETQQIYAHSLGEFLAGTTHSKVFDPETYLLNDSSKVAFESFILKNPKSISAEVVNAYLEMLKTDNFSYSEKVDSFLMNKVYSTELFVEKN